MSKALEALLDYRQLDAAGVVVEASRQAIHEVAAEIERLEARNARLLEALKRLLANIRCECSQFIGGLPPKFGGGRKCDYCNAREAIAEEKEQSK